MRQVNLTQTIVDPRWRLFIKVADLRSVSGAAAALDMPQSVVSRQIAQLESEAGTRLFRRTGRGVLLTDFGEDVYPRMQQLISQADQLADDMRTRSGMPMGDVRFGLLPSAVPSLAGPLFAHTRENWPKVRLHLTEGSSAQLEEWLSQGRLDMALLLREQESPPSDELVLARLPLCLVVPTAHPLARRKSIRFDEVSRLPLVLPSEPHPLRARLAGLMRDRRVTLTQALEADSIRLQHEMVACGGGFAITAGTFAPQDAKRLAALRITHPTLWRSIVLGIAEQRPNTLATRSVAALVRTMAPTLMRPA
jgi:DNA-binding transcriptional LysR family regulator